MKAQFRDVEQFVTELRMVGDTTAAPAPSAALCDVLEGGRVPRAAAVAAPKRHRVRPFVLPVTVGSVLFGGLAGAGALPGPVQHATAAVVAHVGVAIPGASSSGRVPARVPAPAVRAGAEASTTQHPSTATAPGSRTTNPRRSSASTPGTTGRAQQPAGPLPVTPPKLVPPTIPNVTVPTVPLPTPSPVTLPPVTVPTLP